MPAAIEATAQGTPAHRKLGAWLAGILVIAALLRPSLALLIARSPDRAIWPDSTSYVTLADNLLAGVGYRSTATAPLDLIRAPGYPLFLAIVFATLGKSYAAVVTFQLLMGAVIGLTLLWSGKRILSTVVGLGAALIYALTPNAALWALAVLSDVVFAFVLALALPPFIQCFKRGGPGWYFFTGLLLGISSLVRPVGVVLIPIWGVAVCMWVWRHEHAWKSAVLCLLIFLAGAGIPTLPWAIRNERTWGYFGLSSIDVWNLGRYQAPAALARAEDISLDEARQSIPTSRVPQPGDAGRYLRVILAHPIEYAIVHAQGTWLVVSEAGQPNLAQLLGRRYQGSSIVHSLARGDLRGASSALSVAMADAGQRWLLLGVSYGLVFEAVFYALAALGAVRMIRAGGISRWIGLCLALTAVVFVGIPGPVGNSRFRVPAEPFLAFLAGAALPWWHAGSGTGRPSRQAAQVADRPIESAS